MNVNSANIKQNDNERQSLRNFLAGLPAAKKATFIQKREDYLLSALVEEFEK